MLLKPLEYAIKVLIWNGGLHGVLDLSILFFSLKSEERIATMMD